MFTKFADSLDVRSLFGEHPPNIEGRADPQTPWGSLRWNEIRSDLIRSDLNRSDMIRRAHSIVSRQQ